MRQEMQKQLDALNTKIYNMNTKMQEQMLSSIRILSDSCGIPYEEAMKRLSIPEADQAMYLELLRKS